MPNQSAIVIGAGIVGLATARALSLKGYSVTVIERSEKAVGASIRNFGMVWPVGQPDGVLYNRAMRSKEIWKEVADSTNIWYRESGSLHVAYYEDEMQVLEELFDTFHQNGRPVELMRKKDIIEEFEGVVELGLLGGLYSATEMVVDPRKAIATIPVYLSEYLDVQFIWSKAVNRVESGKVWMGNETLQADLVMVCSGADFETLFPEAFAALAITKCKLQMLRYSAGNDGMHIGTSLCGGLSLIHYQSFKAAASLPQLKARYENDMPEYLKWGIHVMVSQNDEGELTVGDTHEYGLTLDPFDAAHLNNLVIQYLQQFAHCTNWTLLQSWNGIYPKMTNGDTEVFFKALPGVYVLNGLGGAGMTLSFGLAEEKINEIV
ncbi:MAG: TIGR03364 family FAD-dependent oxidoreductase [Hydrotalea flava]|uniref:TIGR03364 family FAD-dependent oxidoreductase n=3 Tax=Chitinophagaceae TaxID=563835 RepID=UPI0009432125|nr:MULTISPECIES: TIGR03364 family FAD-dependent oxidoreductase [Hydrotalea]MBY0348681.1 TIGR03364 family FAD-dependent oxidoreductase [Hydrotalea flava]GHU33947.1 oxidoreductase [Bacilli bacterium]NIM35634.1 TIGR03364 family FAD-dependent oxidoreductase [Hydrotalea flava]NIM38493.1 TIGR03364 family FAD-dependent oxidoreductase [Hydrotalea flava]NIN03645.1 TIGR03364 family FAD-dependent oxidoreductase [Hydrotalea flava]